MKKAALAIKKGMTQVFDESGAVVPVTVLDFSSSFLVDIAEKNSNIVVTVGVGEKKRPSKAEQTKYKTVKKVPKRTIQFQLSEKAGFEGLKLGDVLKPSLFEKGDLIQVTAKTKGKGFAGVVKRWNFAGGPKTHGQSDRHRAPGSIGGGTTPGRVYKGKKMAGRMGGKPRTVMNLKVVDVDDEIGTVLVKGAVPGVNGGVVVLRDTQLVKNKKAAYNAK